MKQLFCMSKLFEINCSRWFKMPSDSGMMDKRKYIQIHRCIHVCMCALVHTNTHTTGGACLTFCMLTMAV